MSMVVICPSRGRPEKAYAAYSTFRATITMPTEMIFVVDSDDETRAGYEDRGLSVRIHEGNSGGMGPALNSVLPEFWHDYDIIGFTGDDHHFHTLGWDEVVEGTLAKRRGFAYANDTIRSDIPTQVFISSPIVEALGWMCLPGAMHLYLDDTWAALGRGAGCLYYLPDIIIEHAHPFFGKGTMDAGYARVNSPTVYKHDNDVYQAWRAMRMMQDIEIVMDVVEAA